MEFEWPIEKYFYVNFCQYIIKMLLGGNLNYFVSNLGGTRNVIVGIEGGIRKKMMKKHRKRPRPLPYLTIGPLDITHLLVKRLNINSAFGSKIPYLASSVKVFSMLLHTQSDRLNHAMFFHSFRCPTKI